jgi:hypothetical protein
LHEVRPEGTFDQLKQAHYELMAAYAHVLVRLSRFGLIRTGESDISPNATSVYAAMDGYPKSWGPLNYSWLRMFSLAFMVQLFGTSHIAAKLKELAAAYEHGRQALPIVKAAVNAPDGRGAARNPNADKWLSQVSKECTDFAATLPGFGRVKSIIASFWPLLAGIIVTGLGVSDIYQALFTINQDALTNLMVAIFGPAIYVLVFVSNSFEYKRDIFCPGVWSQEHASNLRLPREVLGTVLPSGQKEETGAIRRYLDFSCS